jgi:hypothetical protein
MLHGSNDGSLCITLEFYHNINMRDNGFKLGKNRLHYDACKYFFCKITLFLHGIV